jgi:hypothetical protein
MKTSTEPRARRVAQLTPGASTLRLRATQWALANGRRLDYDALTVILSAKAEVPVPVWRWTEDDVWRLWWIDLSGWCTRRGVRTPDGLATTMLTLLAHLDDTNGFAHGSDSLDDLEAAMESAGALWQDPSAHAG